MDLKDKLLAKISLDTFNLSMRQQNDEYIKSLTLQIEEYVDVCKNNPELKIEREVFSILQNSNFFDTYIGLYNITSNFPVEDLDDWLVDFGSAIGENIVLHGYKMVSSFLDTIMSRINRIQFIRLSFELDDYDIPSQNVSVDEALERMYKVVYKEKSRSPKN